MPFVNFVKSRPRGHAGVGTYLVMHNFVENGSLQICITKSAYIYFVIFPNILRQAISAKRIGQYIFFLRKGGVPVKILKIAILLLGKGAEGV